MLDWWSTDSYSQYFFVAAAFFSAFFLWQMIMAFIGLSHGMGDDITTQVGDMDHSAVDTTAAADAHESLLAFKLVSIRSVLAFFTLFCWANALYLRNGSAMTWSLVFGLVWGIVAMVAVAGVFHLMTRLTESGNARLGTCLGQSGAVYLDVPASGVGEVRVKVSGVMAHIKARSASGQPIKAGTRVKVLRILDPVTIEVAPDAGSEPPAAAKV